MNKKELFEKSLALEKIDHPTWQDCYLRPLTISDVQRINLIDAEKDQAGLMAVCLLLAVVDDKGNPIFDESDLESLKCLSWRDTLPVGKLVMDKLSDDKREQKKANS